MCIRDRNNEDASEQLRINQTGQHINNNNNKKWATFTYINNKMTKLDVYKRQVVSCDV